MGKRSGFAVKITAFIDADAKNSDDMKRAIDGIQAIEQALKNTQFIAIEVESRFMLSKDIPDAPKAAAEVPDPVEVQDRLDSAAAGFRSMEVEQPPDLPGKLERRPDRQRT
jgi:hypothetical protein